MTAISSEQAAKGKGGDGKKSVTMSGKDTVINYNTENYKFVSNKEHAGDAHHDAIGVPGTKSRIFQPTINSVVKSVGGPQWIHIKQVTGNGIVDKLANDGTILHTPRYLEKQRKTMA